MWKNWGELEKDGKTILIFLIPKVQIYILEWNKTESKWHEVLLYITFYF